MDDLHAIWWERLTNCVICSKYNAAWFVGGLNDEVLLVDIFWTIVGWIVSRLFEIEIMRCCMYNGRIWMLIEWECKIIEWFRIGILLLVFQESWRDVLVVDSSLNTCLLNCKLIDWEGNYKVKYVYLDDLHAIWWERLTNCVICSKHNAAWFAGGLNDEVLVVDIFWTIVGWIVSRLFEIEIMRCCMYNGRIWMLIEWECKIIEWFRVGLLLLVFQESWMDVLVVDSYLNTCL